MMNVLTQSISRVLRGISRSFKTYPAAMASALAFVIVAMVKIQLDWSEQEQYSFLLNSLHYALVLGGIFGLTAVTWAKTMIDDAKSFIIANIACAALVLLTFLLLYFTGGTSSDSANYTYLSAIAISRTIAAMIVSFLGFIILAGYPNDRSDFAKSFFMTHKAFFIALIYGLVIFAGGAAVAGAVQALLYRDMSSKVYMYIGVIAGFLGYGIFIGYFPDFSKSRDDPKREIAQKQPRFIEVLLEYIISPLALALTAVLLIWSGKTAFTGEQVTFTQLASIAAGFSAVGIWLHIMITHGKSPIARFYRRVFPIAAIVILIFEALVLFNQIGKWGVKTQEYGFLLIWLLTLSAVLLLIFLKAKAHRIIAAIICILSVFAVLPVVGYHVLPVSLQTGHLEGILKEEGLLSNNTISPALSEPDRDVREIVTASVRFLDFADDARLPSWFPAGAGVGDVFERTFGFEQTWPGEKNGAQPSDYIGTNLYLPSYVIDLGKYDYALSMHHQEGTAVLPGEGGTYEIYWNHAGKEDNQSVLRIDLDGQTIYDETMDFYIEGVLEKYPPINSKNETAPLEDMTYTIETSQLELLLIFNSVSINTSRTTGEYDYWLDLTTIYVTEK